MRIVASSKASQEQLRAFQAHIDELNAILASRKQQESQPNPPHVKQDTTQQSHPQQPPPPAATLVPAPTPTPGKPGAGPNSTAPASAPSPSPALLPPSAMTPNGPPGFATPVGPPHPGPNSGAASARASPAQNPYPTQPHPPAQPIRSKDSQLPPMGENPYQYPIMRHSIPPAKPDPKAIVFEFVTAGHASTNHAGDRFMIPANTILDYFPGGTTVIASFLAIKKVDLSALPAEQTAAKGKSKKPKTSLTAESASPNGAAAERNGPVQGSTTHDSNSLQTKNEKGSPGAGTSPETTKAPKKSTIKEFYQPVTLRLHANNPRILEPFARVVKPPAEVRQYMNDTMDRMDRADIEYLAFRLPRGAPGPAGSVHGTVAEEGNTAADDPSRGGRNIRRRSKSKSQDETADTDTGGVVDGADGDEEELKPFYDSPSSLVPLSSLQ